LLTEIISGVAGAVASAGVTHYIGRWAIPRPTPNLEGEPLVHHPRYPVVVGQNGRLHIDRSRVEDVCRFLLENKKGNSKMAVDLLYLVEHNWDVAQGSESTRQLVDQVRRNYRRKFGQLVEPQALADQRNDLLAQFRDITNGLGDTFSGTPIEFVLHDARDPIHSVVVIRNSITGRREGDEASTWGENVVRAYADGSWRGARSAYRLRDPNTGREIKATTIALKDSTLGLIGALCINVDIERLSPGSPELASIAGYLVATPGGWGDQVFRVDDSYQR
jgi:YheO-like PAS domain